MAQERIPTEFKAIIYLKAPREKQNKKIKS